MGGGLSVGLRVSSGTKMNHWRWGKVLGKDPERAISKWDACHSKPGASGLVGQCPTCLAQSEMWSTYLTLTGIY